MVDIVYNIFEDDFQKRLTDTYNLSVLLGVDRLSYLISNQQNQVIALRAYQWEGEGAVGMVQQVLLEDSILREKYKAVRVGVFSSKFALVPEVLFDQEQQVTYLAQTARLNQGDEVLSDRVLSLKARNIYAYELAPLQLMREQWGDLQVVHSSTGLIQNFVQNFDSSSSKNIFLNIYNQHVVITVVEQGQLLFHNIFSFKASPDCLYYILLVYKQLGLNPNKHPLYIVGELVEDSEIHKLLYKYIKTIHFVNLPNFYVFGSRLKESFPQNFFFDLYSLKLCE